MGNGEADTKQLILDAAEQLFAQEGFHSTSLRAITTKARVNLASVNYHFGSKDALLEAVFERRLISLNKIRLEKIEKVIETAHKKKIKPQAKDLLNAFIEPTLEFRTSGAGAEDFIALVGRALSDPDDTVRQVFFRLIGPLFHIVFEAMRKALPDLPETVLLWRLHFVFGAFSHVMQLREKDCCPDLFKIPVQSDSGAVMTEFISFMTAGLETR